jgi:hypothetical protein
MSPVALSTPVSIINRVGARLSEANLRVGIFTSLTTGFGASVMWKAVDRDGVVIVADDDVFDIIGVKVVGDVGAVLVDDAVGPLEKETFFSTVDSGRVNSGLFV